MTHRHKMSLLGDFVDNELSDADRAAFRQLLAESDDLRTELEHTVRLKQLLRQKLAPDPGEPYFDELTRLIEARSVERGNPPAETESDRVDHSYQRRMFVRSLASAAASLLLFFAALAIGSRHDYIVSRNEAPGVFLAGAAAEQFEQQGMELATVEEQSSVRKGIFLLSPPGSIGRLYAMQDMIGR